jgi:threonine aldolase
MRQAGIVAAAALLALEFHVDRLADDHARARRLAGGLAEAGIGVDLGAVETNFVAIDVGPLGLTVAEAQSMIADNGVLVSWLRAELLGLATYLGVSDDDVERAIDAIAALFWWRPCAPRKRVQAAREAARQQR